MSADNMPDQKNDDAYATMADGVFNAIKSYIDKRLAGDGTVSRALAEQQYRADRHAEHLARLETRLAKLERGK